MEGRGRRNRKRKEEGDERKEEDGRKRKEERGRGESKRKERKSSHSSLSNFLSSFSKGVRCKQRWLSCCSFSCPCTRTRCETRSANKQQTRLVPFRSAKETRSCTCCSFCFLAQSISRKREKQHQKKTKKNKKVSSVFLPCVCRAEMRTRA